MGAPACGFPRSVTARAPTINSVVEVASAVALERNTWARLFSGTPRSMRCFSYRAVRAPGGTTTRTVARPSASAGTGPKAWSSTVTLTGVPGRALTTTSRTPESAMGVQPKPSAEMAVTKAIWGSRLSGGTYSAW